MDEIPKNTKIIENPYKKDVYETYVAWRSIPAFTRQLEAEKACLYLDMKDDVLAELLPIRTQTEFAEKYGVENSTLSNWNKLIKEQEPLSEAVKWASSLTKNVVFALYKRAIETGRAAEVKLFLEVVCGWDQDKISEPEHTCITEFLIQRDDGVIESMGKVPQ